MHDPDGNARLHAEVTTRMRVVIEERWRWRGCRKRSSCCSSRGEVAALVIML